MKVNVKMFSIVGFMLMMISMLNVQQLEAG